MADYKCEKCGMSVIVTNGEAIRPCSDTNCKEKIVASISATVYAVGKTNNEKDKRNS